MPIKSQPIPLPKLPTPPKGPRAPRGFGKTTRGLRVRPVQGVSRLEAPEPAGDPPGWWRAQYPSGTKPEWAVWWGLLQNGLKPEIDFVYQANFPGMGVGYYSTTDYMLPDLRIALEVQGEFWHYGVGAEKQFHDMLRFQALAAEGIQLIFIDENDALTRPKWIVKEAIAGRDHSKLATKF